MGYWSLVLVSDAAAVSMLFSDFVGRVEAGEMKDTRPDARKGDTTGKKQEIS